MTLVNKNMEGHQFENFFDNGRLAHLKVRTHVYI